MLEHSIDLCHFSDECFGQLALCAPRRREPLAQVGAEMAEFVDAGDYAVLFGEGW